MGGKDCLALGVDHDIVAPASPITEAEVEAFSQRLDGQE
jgi:hypothetical protein